MAGRERPLHELLSRQMVDIYVGPENTHWILHEKLLCHRSKFFRDIFYNKKGTKNTAYGLPDEEDEPFKLFVGWLYSDNVPAPTEEKELAPLFDLYLMAEKWEIKKLVVDVLETVRQWYHDTDTWPGLRRVQYIYANTEQESPMRQLLVSCVARMLIVGDSMPAHWEKALRKNGQLAVDIIMCVQTWRVDPDNVPDSRHGSMQAIVNESDEKKEINKQMQEFSDDKEEAGGLNGVKQEDSEAEANDSAVETAESANES